MGTLRILTRAASLPAATLLLLTFFLLLPQAARAQWTTSGNDISNTNTGNVGVGVGNTTPKYKIDLSAANTQLRFGSDTSDSGGYLISTVPSQALMAGGAVWNGSAWVAKTTSASFFEASLGSLKFYTNTGLTAGSTFSSSQRMIIDSSGNVGIGTATPHTMLEVVGGTLFGTVDGGNMTATDSSAMAQNVGGSISFAAKYDTAGNYAGFARILGVKENATSGNYGGALIFETRANGGNQTEYMRVTSTGNVGIGTATPTTAKLVISGSAGATGLDLSSTDQYAEMRVIRNSLGSADKDL